MTEKKNSEHDESTVTTYGTTKDVTKHPKGQAPTQSLNDGAPQPQPGTEDLKI